MNTLSLPLALSLGLLLALAGDVRAQSGDQSFEAVVTVDAESDRSRREGLRKALRLVLRRVVGRTEASTAAILERAEALVQQYQFLRDPGDGTIKFRAVFDPASVTAAVKEQGLPVFGLDPTLVDAWIVEVRGLRTAADYSQVFGLFNELSGVRRLEVSQLVEDRVRLRMIVEGGLERANLLVLSAGLIRQEGEGAYVFAGN